MLRPKIEDQRFRIILILLIVVIAFYFFYFFIILNQKQQNLVEKGYRILMQISKNIDDKYNNYQGSLPNFVKQEEFINTFFFELDSTKEIDSSLYLGYNILKDENSYLSAILKSNIDTKEKESKTKEYISSLQNINLKTIDITNKSDYLISIGKDKYVTIHDFMESIKHDDFFADIIVYLKDSTVLYSQAFDKSFYNQIKWDSIPKKELNHYALAGKDYKVLSLPININNQDYILFGLIDNNKYAGVSKQFSPFALASVGIVIFLLLTSIPLLKLRLLSRYERLRRGDVYLAGLSTIMVASFSTLIALGIANSFIEKNIIKKNLEHLSSNISNELVKEIKTIKTFLKGNEIDSTFLSKTQYYPYNIWNEMVSININGYIENYQTGFYPYFGKTDSLGATLKTVNLSTRKYFQEIKNTKPKDSLLYLEPVYSYTTGNVEGALSQKSLNKIKLITSPLYSLLDIVLPKHYSYYIIDSNGQVMFHEKNKKILRENFFDEINNTNKIIQSIQSGVNRCINLNYNDKPTLCRIAPLKIPSLKNEYSLITTFDLYALQSQVIFKTLSTGILLTFYFILLLLISVLLKFNKQRPVLLRNKVFSFHFLLPSLKHQQKYLPLMLLHFILISPLIYLLFNDLDSSFKYKFIQIINTVLFSSFFTFYYTNDVNFKNGIFYNRKFYAEVLLIFIILTVFLTIYNYGIFYSYYIILFLLFFWKSLWIKKSRAEKNYSKTFRRFHWFAFSWLLLIAIVPTFVVFSHSEYMIEQHQVKESIYYYQQNFEKQKKIIEKKYSYDSRQKKGKLDKQKIYFKDSIYQLNLQSLLKGDNSNKNLANTNNLPDDITIYQAFSDLLNLSKLNNDLLINSDTLTTQNDIYSQTQYLKKRNLIRNKYFYIVIFASGMILACIVILPTIVAFTRRVKPLYTEGKQPISIENLRKFKKLILVGMPGTRKELIVDSVIKNEKISQRINFAHLNYDEIAKELDKMKTLENGTIILENFDHNHNHHGLNKLRLLCLQALIDKPVRTILTSSISLNQILDDFFNLWLKADSELQDNIKANMDQLESLLFDYTIVTLPLPSFEKGPLAIEFGHGHYLFSLQNQFEHNPKYREITNFNELPRQFKEELVIEVQNMAHAYYHALWNHCTRMEKHVLYDAAEDGFINHKNKITIANLLKKGLLVFDDGVKIMNRSFQHFILTGISSSEVMQMEQEAKTRGRWSRYSLVIAVVILSTIIFYILAEQQVVNKFTALISGLIAFVPSLISILRSTTIKSSTSK